MTSKRQRKIAKKKARETISEIAADLPSSDERYHPKAGPGQVFTRELIGMESGHAKRFRNIGQSALTLAYHRGQLCSPPGSISPVRAEERYAAGEHFERVWALIHHTNGRDSTQFVIKSSDHLLWTERRQEASDQIARWAARMERTNFRIVRAFCGEGHSMRAAIRIAGLDPVVVPSHRIREALDDLVYITGRAQRSNGHAKSAATIASDGIPLHPFQERS